MSFIIRVALKMFIVKLTKISHCSLGRIVITAIPARRAVAFSRRRVWKEKLKDFCLPSWRTELTMVCSWLLTDYSFNVTNFTSRDSCRLIISLLESWKMVWLSCWLLTDHRFTVANFTVVIAVGQSLRTAQKGVC